MSQVSNKKTKEQMILQAKPVIKNKFWVVEQAGQQVATIQATPEGVVLVHEAGREKFVNFKLLSAKYNIHVGRAAKTAKSMVSQHDIYGYPADCKPHNELYDVRRRLPFYTKSAKSKSYYCAGYYAVNLNDEWIEQFCPKSITISRYSYHGPYRTSTEADRKIKSLNTNESL